MRKPQQYQRYCEDFQRRQAGCSDRRLHYELRLQATRGLKQAFQPQPDESAPLAGCARFRRVIDCQVRHAKKLYASCTFLF